MKMCLPNFVEFRQITENEALIGYKNWRNTIDDPLILKSESREYNWNKLEGPHEVLDRDSGIYAYNNYNYYYNYNYNYYYYNNYYYNYNYNYYDYYYLGGIIKQWGKVAIHEEGQRSEFAKIDTLFNIREYDAKGPEKFLNWIKEFNLRIEELAKKYECKVISWQDFKESNK